MNYNTNMHIGKLDPLVHFACESLAYFVGFRLYIWLKKRDSLDFSERIRIIASCFAGAAIGCKLIAILGDPATIYSHFVSVESFVAGKGIVGALVGGWLGIEICKALTGIKSATGDSFVIPLVVAIVIGRIGCFLTGFYDHTYGIPCDLPWAVDFGDGIRRHPTQLYEIAFVSAIPLMIHQLRRRLVHQGDQFKFFMSAYMTFRLFVETVKPVPHPYFELDAEQVVAIAVLLYYSRFLVSLRRPAAQIASTSHD